MQVDDVMPLRTFTTRDGSRWSVWHIYASAQSDALGVPTSWLLFQNEDATVRRRLMQFPADWDALSDEQLEALSDSATLARTPSAGVAQIGAPDDLTNRAR